MTGEEETIQLVFRPSPQPLELRTTGVGQKVGEFVTTLRELTGWFHGFDVDAIELWLEGGSKEGAITKLFLSFEGKGGCKIILKPSAKQ